MRKNALILLLIYCITGCSVVKRETNTDFLSEENQTNSYEQIRALNITNKDFNIIKAEIDISTDNEKQKLLGSIKYKTPETYLISIRNKSGIEAARILITSDTIMINDRINKKLYYGNT